MCRSSVSAIFFNAVFRQELISSDLLISMLLLFLPLFEDIFDDWKGGKRIGQPGIEGNVRQHFRGLSLGKSVKLACAHPYRTALSTVSARHFRSFSFRHALP